MKTKAMNLWEKITHARANIWLTVIVIVLFLTTITVLDALSINYQRTQARYTTNTINQDLGAGQIKLTPTPSSVVLGQPIYLIAEFSNTATCEVTGPTLAQPRALTSFDSGKTLVYGSAPIQHPGTVYTYTLTCTKPDTTTISTPGIVTFIDPSGNPSAFLTGQEVNATTRQPLGIPITSGTLSITLGSGVKLDRLCLNGQSGYISNAQGTILTSITNRAKASETYFVLHDDGDTARGIHSDKTYTAHCFSKTDLKGQESTSQLRVNVR